MHSSGINGEGELSGNCLTQVHNEVCVYVYVYACCFVCAVG